MKNKILCLLFLFTEALVASELSAGQIKKYESYREFHRQSLIYAGVDEKGFVHNRCNGVSFTALYCIAMGLESGSCPVYQAEHESVKGMWFRHADKTCIQYDQRSEDHFTRSSSKDPWGRGRGSRSDNSFSVFQSLALLFWKYRDLDAVERILLFALEDGFIPGSDRNSLGSIGVDFLFAYSFFHPELAINDEVFWKKQAWEVGRSRPGVNLAKWYGSPGARSFRSFYLKLWEKLGGTNPKIRRQVELHSEDYDSQSEFEENGSLPTAGYKRHLIALRVLLLNEMGLLGDYEYDVMKQLAATEEKNALYQAIVFRIARTQTERVQAKRRAEKTLADTTLFPRHELPSTENYRTEYLFQRNSYEIENGRQRLSKDWSPQEEGRPLVHSGTDFMWAACLLYREDCLTP